MLGPGLDTAEQTQVLYPGSRDVVERLAVKRELELNGETIVTVGCVLSAYADYSPSVHTPGTTAGISRAARWASKSGLASHYEHELGAAEVARAQDVLRAQLKGNTVRTYAATWARAWSWARTRGIVTKEWPKVPCVPLKRKDRTKKRALTEDEVISLLGFALTYSQGRYHSLILALAETAARVGELLKCDRSSLVVREDGSGLLRLLHTKTGEPRAVPTSPMLTGALSVRASGPLWTSRTGARLSHSTAHNLMLRWRADQGLEGQVDLHSLRRYAIARMERSGVPRAAGRQVSGHASSVVYDSYASSGAYDPLQAVRALWIGTSPSQVSQDTAKLPGQTQQPPGVSVTRNSLIQFLGSLAGEGFAGRRVPACPALRVILETAPCALPEACRALRLTLERH